MDVVLWCPDSTLDIFRLGQFSRRLSKNMFLPPEMLLVRYRIWDGQTHRTWQAAWSLRASCINYQYLFKSYGVNASLSPIVFFQPYLRLLNNKHLDANGAHFGQGYWTAMMIIVFYQSKRGESIHTIRWKKDRLRITTTTVYQQEANIASYMQRLLITVTKFDILMFKTVLKLCNSSKFKKVRQLKLVQVLP